MGGYYIIHRDDGSTELMHKGRQGMHWYKHLPDVAARLAKRVQNSRNTQDATKAPGYALKGGPSSGSHNPVLSKLKKDKREADDALSGMKNAAEELRRNSERLKQLSGQSSKPGSSNKSSSGQSLSGAKKSEDARNALNKLKEQVGGKKPNTAASGSGSSSDNSGGGGSDKKPNTSSGKSSNRSSKIGSKLSGIIGQKAKTSAKAHSNGDGNGAKKDDNSQSAKSGSKPKKEKVDINVGDIQKVTTSSRGVVEQLKKISEAHDKTEYEKSLPSKDEVRKSIADLSNKQLEDLMTRRKIEDRYYNEIAIADIKQGQSSATKALETTLAGLTVLSAGLGVAASIQDIRRR